MDFGGDDQAIARRPKLLERAPQDFLAGPERVDVGRVEEINAGFQRLADQRPALLLFQHPLAPLPRAVGHAPEADPRHLDAGRAQIHVFHGLTLERNRRRSSARPLARGMLFVIGSESRALPKAWLA